MLDSVMRRLPLAAYLPLRQAIFQLGRRHPARIVATLILRRAARAHRGALAARLTEIRPLDAPNLTFEPTDSMVMDAVFWFGTRGYEGVVARVWKDLCARSGSILEVGGNVGLFTVMGADATKGAYTVVEPVPANAAILRANLARNGLTKAEVLEAAVVPGDVEREVWLSLPDEGRAAPVGAHLRDDVEVADRGAASQLAVVGLPMRRLAVGRDLIKIDAEGIEAALLADIRPFLIEARPDLLIEVLPEAHRLGEFLSALAAESGHRIHVLPEFGSERIVVIPAAEFTSETPRRFNSKDVVLSVRALG